MTSFLHFCRPKRLELNRIVNLFYIHVHPFAAHDLFQTLGRLHSRKTCAAAFYQSYYSEGLLVIMNDVLVTVLGSSPMANDWLLNITFLWMTFFFISLPLAYEY